MGGRPLDTFTVLDLSQGIAGPTAGALLADYGADVVAVEPPGGATQRRLAGGSAHPNVGRNKRSIVLDLKSDRGPAVLHELVEGADALIQNNRPGKMEQLGCGYGALAEVNPALVYCSVTGYGESGPYRDRPGIDPLAQAVSGLMWVTGEPDRKPSRIGGPVVDVAAGIHAAFATVTAMLHADATGEGQKVEASLFDTAAAIMGNWYTQLSATGSVPSRQGHSWDAYAPSGVFETGTGPIYLATPFQAIWERLCRSVDREDWIDDPRFATDEDRLANRDALFETMEAEFSDYDRSRLLDRMVDAGVPASELHTVEEAANDRHLRERGTVRQVEDADGDEVLVTASPLRFSGTPAEIERVAPTPGEHTREVLEESGFSSDDIETLFGDEVVDAE